MIVVWVRSETPARIAEALRVALGVTLRGDRVTVLLDAVAATIVRAPLTPADIARAFGTLKVLGHDVLASGDSAAASMFAAASTVEVWT